MNKLFQVLAFCLMYLGLDAQTTEDEYRYAAGGFKKASEFGFGEKQGYSIQPYSGEVFQTKAMNFVGSIIEII